MQKTKMDEVVKRNIEAMIDPIEKALLETFNQLRSLAIEQDFKYSKEQLILEGRCAMLITALTSLKSFLETNGVSSDEYEDILKSMGREPKQVSKVYRREITEYFLHSLGSDEHMELLSKVLLHHILN